MDCFWVKIALCTNILLWAMIFYISKEDIYLDWRIKTTKYEPADDVHAAFVAGARAKCDVADGGGAGVECGRADQTDMRSKTNLTPHDLTVLIFWIKIAFQITNSIFFSKNLSNLAKKRPTRPFFYATSLPYTTGHTHCRFGETKFSIDQLHSNNEWLLQVVLNKRFQID